MITSLHRSFLATSGLRWAMFLFALLLVAARARAALTAIPAAW